MQEKDVKIDLGAVQTTLLLPLWSRAKETEKKNPLVLDPFAKEIVAKIDYDFSRLEAGQAEKHQIVWAIRAHAFDNTIRDLLAQNPNAVVVNFGAGLDTTFRRIDNGKMLWVNIDLPDVVAVRKSLIPDSRRETTIARSIFDFTWISDVAEHTENRHVIFIAAGVLFYFAEYEVETLFTKLAQAFPKARFVFDAMSWFTVWGANTFMMKQSGMGSARLKWHMKRASSLKKWVPSIRIVEEFSMFAKVPFLDDWSKKMVRDMKIANLLRMYNMIHVQFS